MDHYLIDFLEARMNELTFVSDCAQIYFQVRFSLVCSRMQKIFYSTLKPKIPY